MTTVIIDEKSKEGKALLEFLKSTKYAEIVSKEPNATTIAAMQDIHNGKTIKSENVEEMFKKIGF